MRTDELVLAIVSFVVASVIALALHEAGHVIAAAAFGVRVKRIGIGWRGPFIVREPGPPLLNACIALAGPLMNLLLAALFWTAFPIFAQINLALGLTNMIPVQKSDGLRIWTASHQLLASDNHRGF